MANLFTVLSALATTISGVGRSVVTAATTTAARIAMSSSATQSGIALVDQVNGSDTTGSVGGQPYATLAAALAAAVAPGVVFCVPGTYTLAAGITIPAGVTLAGASSGVVTIQLTTAVAADLVTMSAGAAIESVTLRLTGTADVQLRGVVFPGTTTATARLANVSLTVDNSAAPGAVTSAVYGIHSTGTGSPAAGVHTLTSTDVFVNGAGAGAKRGILVDSASLVTMTDSAFVVTRTGPAVGTYIGAEVNHAAGQIGMQTGSLSGVTADVSQTAGKFSPSGVRLVHSTANGLGIDQEYDPQIIALIWGDDGTLTNGTRFLRPGTGTSSATEIKVKLLRDRVLVGMTVRAIAGPGGVLTTTFAARIDGVDTTVATSLTGAATSAIDTAHSATLLAQHDLSVRYTAPGGDATSDVYVVLYLY